MKLVQDIVNRIVRYIGMDVHQRFRIPSGWQRWEGRSSGV